jgi:hypothetical protein
MTSGLFLCGILLIGLLLALSATGSVRLSLVHPDPTTTVGWTLLIYYVVMVLFGFDPQLFYRWGPQFKYAEQYCNHPGPIAAISVVSAIGLILGLAMGRSLIGKRVPSWEKWYKQPIVESRMTATVEASFSLALVLAVLLSATYVAYIGGLTKLPLYMMFTGRSCEEIIFAREESFKFLPFPLSHIFHSLRVFIFPFLICYSYVSLRIGRRTPGAICRFGITFLCGATFSASSSALGPVLELVLQLVMCELAIGRLSPIKTVLRGTALVGGILFLHYVMIGLTAGEFPDPIETAAKLLREQVLYRGYTIFEGASSFTNVFDEGPVGAAAIPKLASLLGIEPRYISNEMFLAIIPDCPVTSGTWNGPWFMYDYVAFGIPGVAVGSFMFGLLLRGFSEYLKAFAKDRVVVAVVGYSIVSSLGIFDTQVSTWLFSQGGALGAAFLYLMRYTSTAIPLKEGASIGNHNGRKHVPDRCAVRGSKPRCTAAEQSRPC